LEKSAEKKTKCCTQASKKCVNKGKGVAKTKLE